MNTDYHSLDRIWIKSNIAERTYSLEKDDKNSIPDVIAFLQMAETLGKEKGFVDIKVKVGNVADTTEEYDWKGYDYISVEGYRLENDYEYLIRLESLKGQLIRSKNNWEKQKQYYEFGAYVTKLNVMDDLIAKLLPPTQGK